MITTQELQQLTAKQWRAPEDLSLENDLTKRIRARMIAAKTFTSKDLAKKMGISYKPVQNLAYKLALKGKVRKIGFTPGSPRNGGARSIWEYVD